MADASEAGASSSGTLISDIHPEDFVLRDFIVEIATLIQERQAFLDSKVQRKTIGKEEQNLALFRLIRMHALHHYLKRIEAHKAGRPAGDAADLQFDARPAESPLKDFVQEIESEADREAGRVEEFEQHQDKVVQPEPEALPSKAPKVDHDDWD